MNKALLRYLLVVAALPAYADVVCTGTSASCSGAGGTVASPVATDPLSFTGVVTFNNAVNTPVTASDGIKIGTLVAGRVTFAGAAGLLSDDADFTFATDTLTVTHANVKAGTGSGTLNVGGVLCKGAGSAAGSTSEEVLGTCTIPANTLTAVGSGLRVIMNWTTAANANNKTISLRLGGIGGVVLWTSGAVAWNNQRVLQLTGPLIISYESATTGTAGGQVTGITAAGSAAGTSANYGKAFTGVDWTASQALVFTKTTPTAASDASLQLFSVEVVQ